MSEREREKSRQSKELASEDSNDSLVRGAAEISEPSPSTLEAAQRGAPRKTVERTPGEVIAKRYRLDHELGRGGMGIVWAATHLVTRKRCAIKFLKGPADAWTDRRRRFLREARAASAIDHHNVLQVTDLFELEDETPVIVMELLIGETLRDKLAREGRLPLADTASILFQVISAVQSGHELGIVHRDLKPENIFLARGPSGEQVKVLDFGIAKLLSRDAEAPETDSLTSTGSILGTPSYMAPEQTEGEIDVDHRADIWALGIITYECLAGVRPVQGANVVKVAINLAAKGIEPLEDHLPDLPPEITRLVARMLARERKERPQDLKQVLEVLSRYGQKALRVPATPGASNPNAHEERTRRELSHSVPVDTEAPQALPRGSRRPPRRSFLVSGLAGGMLLLMAFMGWMWSRGLAPSATPSATASSARTISTTQRSAVPAFESSSNKALFIAPPPSDVASVSATPPSGARSTGVVPAGIGRPKPSPTPTRAASAKEEPALLPIPSASESPPPKQGQGGIVERAPF